MASCTGRPYRERSSYCIHGDSLSLKVGVLIDLLGGGDVGVANDRLGITGRNAKVLHKGRSAVAEVVELDARQTRLGADLVEGPHEAFRVDGCPDAALEAKTDLERLTISGIAISRGCSPGAS